MAWSEADLHALGYTLVDGTATPTESPSAARTAPQQSTERQFQAQVIALATRLGWKVYHTHDSRKSQPGFPDLVLVRECVLWVELKTNTGKLTPEQATWLSLLEHAGQETAIWRPRDWDTIAERLGRRTTRSALREEI